MDAARLLPIFGAVLFAVPLLWPAGTDQNAAQGTVQMSDAILYIFAIWSALIVIIALFGLGTRLWTGTDGPQRSGQE